MGSLGFSDEKGNGDQMWSEAVSGERFLRVSDSHPVEEMGSKGPESNMARKSRFQTATRTTDARPRGASDAVTLNGKSMCLVLRPRCMRCLRLSCDEGIEKQHVVSVLQTNSISGNGASHNGGFDGSHWHSHSQQRLVTVTSIGWFRSGVCCVCGWVSNGAVGLGPRHFTASTLSRTQQETQAGTQDDAGWEEVKVPCVVFPGMIRSCWWHRAMLKTGGGCWGPPGVGVLLLTSARLSHPRRLSRSG